MKQEKVLFAVIWLLLGFLLGYISPETMASRQPTRLVAGATPPPSATPPRGGTGPAGQPAGQPAMAQVQQLRAYVDANPNDGPAVRQLADLNFDISNWQRAIDLYEHYLTLDANNVEVMTDLGVSYRSMGNAERALATFRRAVETRPDHWQARYNEVIVLAFDLGDLDAAGKAVAELQAAQPQNTEVGRLAAEIERRSAAAS